MLTINDKEVNMDNFLNELYGMMNEQDTVYPPTLSYADGTKTFFLLNVAGYKSSELLVELKDAEVVVTGTPDKSENMLIGGKFTVKKVNPPFKLSKKIQPGSTIEAVNENGVLYIIIEAPTTKKGKTIPITIS